ncbi:MAG: sulfatase-like hydrolase/transferase [Planctomycetales bacterium]|nr:sulfatase-like hydrolase/transferase [Planctomycetales bacterium]
MALALSVRTATGGDDQRSSEAQARPNIVVLLADDLGYGEPGCYGAGGVATPHIDALAKAGVRCTDGYVSAPFCAASRAGLLTGRYQTRFGFEFNPIGAKNEDPDVGLPVEESTLADHLRGAGYATGLLGKWHLGGTAKFHPQRRGFDEFFGFLHEGHYYLPPPWTGATTWLRRTALPDGAQGRWTSPSGRIVWSTHMGHREPDYDANNPILRGSQPVDERSHLTEAITREAEAFIDRCQDQPFFLLVAYNAVHSPLQGLDAYMDRAQGVDDVQRRIFAAMLMQLDDSVGRIVARLRERRLEERTLIVFLSDNGGPTRELTSSNLPLRGEKGQLYEGGIRVPLIVQWKGSLPAGAVLSQPICAIDLAPTLLAAARVAAPAKTAFDGVNVLPQLAGQTDALAHERLYWRVGPRAALRQGDWKIVRHRAHADEGGWELFHLADDVSEQRDQAQLQPQRLTAMVAAWREIDAAMQSPRW